MAKKKSKITVTETNALNTDKTIAIESNVPDVNKMVLANNETDTNITTTIINPENVVLKKDKTLKDLDINELISFEKACALLCKRFETSAQLDYNNHFLFKEYQYYYELIFNEIKERVSACCSKIN